MSEDSEIIVIKLGGHAMDDVGLFAAFIDDMVELHKKGHQIVIVHGGGPHINALLQRLGIASKFISGHRVTDTHTLNVVEMALCGTVNKEITRALLDKKIPAAGISGQDGTLLEARIKSPELGLVGEIIRVNPAILWALLKNGFVPVIAPVALSPEKKALNINADTAAGAIASALLAMHFILISDVPGVLDEENQLLPELDSAQIEQLITSGVAKGGMLPKLECCHSALRAGCHRAVILDGSRKNALSLCIAQEETPGTIIKL